MAETGRWRGDSQRVKSADSGKRSMGSPAFFRMKFMSVVSALVFTNSKKLRSEN